MQLPFSLYCPLRQSWHLSAQTHVVPLQTLSEGGGQTHVGPLQVWTPGGVFAPEHANRPLPGLKGPAGGAEWGEQSLQPYGKTPRILLFP